MRVVARIGEILTLTKNLFREAYGLMLSSWQTISIYKREIEFLD